MSGFLVPKNWSRFQHYRHRRPPWIKLHREMLDNYEFHRLPVASRALAPCLWLLAAEYENGRIPDVDASVAFRVHLSVKDYVAALNPLVDALFFERYQDASMMLAPRKQLATSETETETETEIVKSGDFETWWSVYPRKVGKGAAVKAYAAAIKKIEPCDLLTATYVAASAFSKVDPKFIPHPTTWLNQERWSDEPAPTNGAAKRTVFSEFAS